MGWKADSSGTGIVAQQLYELGYGAHRYPHTQKGEAKAEVVAAVQDRMVSYIAMYGYSLGGSNIRVREMGLRLIFRSRVCLAVSARHLDASSIQ